MEIKPKLIMMMIGCTPKGRLTEQHDMFFTIANSIAEVKNEVMDFWPEANEKIHLDAWREVNEVDGYEIEVLPVADTRIQNPNKLFFLNLGGYRKDEFDEFHYKLLVVAPNQAEAIKKAKETAFYKHNGYEGAPAHVDNKYGVDVDELFEVQDILSDDIKSRFNLSITPLDREVPKDEIHLGYMLLSKL
jgi:hypothetical protein